MLKNIAKQIAQYKSIAEEVSFERSRHVNDSGSGREQARSVFIFIEVYFSKIKRMHGRQTSISFILQQDYRL